MNARVRALAPLRHRDYRTVNSTSDISIRAANATVKFVNFLASKAAANSARLLPLGYGINLNIPGNAATQFYGLLNAPAQIETAREMARAKGGLVHDISRLRSGNFYVATEGEAFHRIVAPWCLSYHPPSPPSAEEVLSLAQRSA